MNVEKKGDGDLTRAVKYVVKVIIFGIAVIALIVVAVFGYIQYDNLESSRMADERLNAQLLFKSRFDSYQNFKWNNKYAEIQEGKSIKTGRTILRKVKLDENQEIVVIRRFIEKSQKYGTVISVTFFVSCKAGTKITTTTKYSDGEQVKLSCNDSGTALNYAIIYDDIPGRLDENLNGFIISESLSSWDINYLDREDALLRAK